MATVIINDSTYEWPDSGDKNWAANVTRVIQKVAVEIDRNRTTAAKQGDNNVFTAANRFENVPTVGAEGSADKVETHVATIADVRSQAGELKTELADDLVESQTEISAINDRIGSDTTTQVYEDLGLATLAGASGIVNGAADATILKGIQSVLAEIKEQNNIHNPIGSYKYLDVRSSSISTPQWRQVRNADDSLYDGTARPHDNAYWFNASFLADGQTQHSWVHGSQAGGDAWFEFVESDSNLWAFCDGTFPLPPSHFGTNGTWTEAELGASHNGVGTPKLYFIADMRDRTFMAGVGKDVITNNFTGNNELFLSELHLPYHSHQILENDLYVISDDYNADSPIPSYLEEDASFDANDFQRFNLQNIEPNKYEFISNNEENVTLDTIRLRYGKSGISREPDIFGGGFSGTFEAVDSLGNLTNNGIGVRNDTLTKRYKLKKGDYTNINTSEQRIRIGQDRTNNGTYDNYFATFTFPENPIIGQEVNVVISRYRVVNSRFQNEVTVATETCRFNGLPNITADNHLKSVSNSETETTGANRPISLERNIRHEIAHTYMRVQ